MGANARNWIRNSASVHFGSFISCVKVSLSVRSLDWGIILHSVCLIEIPHRSNGVCVCVGGGRGVFRGPPGVRITTLHHIIFYCTFLCSL